MQESSDRKTMTRILDIPPEIVEDILVYLAGAGHITSVSSLAQTCRKMRQVIYGPMDKHLWRRMFLSTFDDPRHSGRVVCHGSEEDFNTFDWGKVTRRRICAAFRLKPRSITADPRVKTYRLRSGERAAAYRDIGGDFTSHLNVLISVLEEAQPKSPQCHEPVSNNLSLVEASERSTSFPSATEDSSTASKNLDWLENVLAQGFPCELACRFGHSRVDRNWLQSAESQALHRIIAHVGIRPLLSSPALGPNDRYKRRWRQKDSYQWMSLNEEGRRGLARHLSQTRAYDMAYPSCRRGWGPYLRIQDKSETDQETSGSEVETFSNASDEVAQRATDWTVWTQHLHEHLDDEDYHPDAVMQTSQASPDQLYPDWVQLAAIRVVVEHRLLDDDDYSVAFDHAALTSLEALRAQTWSAKTDTEALDVDEQSLFERDWAGVEGIWRRCVCWLGYPMLINQNVHAFRDEVDEEMVIVPLHIKITGYSSACVKGYENFPTIHYLGQMGGADWEVGEDVRRIRGTVGIIADGSIRWTGTSSVEGADEEDEWASEGIQLGGVGSDAGVVGMWTGAQHEHNDPIGAWWQWRVA